LDMDDVQTQEPWANYSLLGEDSNLKLLNEIRVDPRNTSQVICSVIFTNLTSHHIQQLEFNVINSLNMKLVRQTDSTQDPILVPFQLLPNMTNEGQFAFTLDSCVMCQYLRGTLTYIVKDGETSTSEKIDFRIFFPVSKYIQAQPITSVDFTNLLASGDLTQKQSLKVKLEAEDVELSTLVQLVCNNINLTVVECVDNGASLYGYTIQNHPICFLLKILDGGSVSIDAKSTDFQLLSSLLKEVEEVIASE